VSGLSGLPKISRRSRHPGDGEKNHASVTPGDRDVALFSETGGMRLEEVVGLLLAKGAVDAASWVAFATK
jgi:hypothetical protein